MKKIIDRAAAPLIIKAAKTFPAVILTGPRQSGKTTLLKKLFSKKYEYICFDDTDIRLRVKDDPAGFINRINKPVILDEIQYCPELLPYIKIRIDQKRVAGFWILTGSQNFALMSGISESLSGRIAVLSLLPFSWSELTENKKPLIFYYSSTRPQKNIKKIFTNKKKESVESIMLRGFYPEPALNKKIDSKLWCSSYISTYIERDIRTSANITDLTMFARFVKMLAVRTGQILNLSEISRELGISVPTAQRWLSLLESGYQCFLLYPYYRNIGKRLNKSPKIYFNDTALAANMLGLHTAETLVNSPYFSHLFETMVVTDFWKKSLQQGRADMLYYLKTYDGFEVDLAVEHNHKLHLFEIKSSVSITPQHCSSLKKALKDLKNQVISASIISRSQEIYYISENIINFPWYQIL